MTLHEEFREAGEEYARRLAARETERQQAPAAFADWAAARLGAADAEPGVWPSLDGQQADEHDPKED